MTTEKMAVSYNNGSKAVRSAKPAGLVLFAALLMCVLMMQAQDAAYTEEAHAATKTVKYKAATILSWEVHEAGILINWKKISAAEKYYVYRKTGDEEEWFKVKTLTGNTSVYYYDKDLVTGIRPDYKVIAYYTVSGDGEEAPEPETLGDEKLVTAAYVAPPVLNYCSRKTRSVKVSWEPDPVATGYVISCCSNSLFKGARKITLNDGGRDTYTIKNLKSGKKYYVRIKTVMRKVSSGWTHSSLYLKSRKAKVTYLKRFEKYKVKKKVRIKSKKRKGKKKKYKTITVTKKKKVRFDIRVAAKQDLHGYDTVQGSTSYGRSSYMVLLNKKKKRCKIVRMRAGGRKVYKVSKPLKLGHGSDLAYSPYTGTLAVVHGQDHKGYITLVKAKTLKKVRNVRIKIPKYLYGASTKILKKIKRYSGISYLPASGGYLLKTIESNSCIVLDRNFKPQRIIKMGKKILNQGQATNTHDGYILRITSPGKKSGNIIYIHNKTGSYLTSIRIPVVGELEGVYFVGNRLYCSVYRSRVRTGTKKVKAYKWVKRRGRYRKKRYTKRVRYRYFYKDNYVARISRF